jgi:capsular exopolysaccharide synthesis family protein
MRFLESQIPVAKERLKDIEKKLEEYKSSTGIISVDEYVNTLSSELSNFDHIYNETIIEYSSKETQLKSLKERLNEVKKNLSIDLSGIVNSSIKNIRTELFNLENELLTYELKGITQDNQRVSILKKNIEDLKKKLQEEVVKVAGDSIFVNDSLKIIETEIDFEILKSKMEVLENLKKDYEKKMRSFPFQETKFLSFIREYKIAEDVVKLLTEKYEEFRIEEAKKIGNVKVIEYATIPIFPVKPQKKLSLLLGFFGGILIGIIGVVLLEIFANKIVDEDDVRENCHIPVIAIIPEVKIKNNDGFSKYLITNLEKNKELIEAYRIMKTNINFLNIERRSKVFLVTSSLPEEGKSTVSSNIAITTANAGYNTILIDLDLRKPSLHKVFGIENSFGLTDIVMNPKRLEDSIHKIKDNLYFLKSGTIPPDASEIISSNNMKEIMEKISRKFDYVFIDSPPLIIPETRLIGLLSDGVILVLKSNYISPETLHRSINVINSIEKRIIGIVITRLKKHHRSYYYYQYYYNKEEKND